MSDPTGGNEILVGVRVERQGAEVLPQVRQQVVQFDTALKNVTTTSGTGATTLFNLNKQQERLGETATTGTRGLHMVRSAAAALAFQAAGVPGAVGKIAEGLLLFGAGSTVVLGAVAGLALVATAIRAVTQDTRDDIAAQEALEQKLSGMGAHGEATAARLRLAQLEQERDAPTLAQRFHRAPTFAGPRIAGGWRPEELEQINREIAEQQGILDRAMLKFEDPQARALREASQGRREAGTRQRLIGAEVGLFGPGLGEGTERVTASTLALAEALRVERLEYEHIPPAIARKVAAQERETAEQTLMNDLTLDTFRQSREAELINQMVFASQEEVTEAIRRRKLEMMGLAPAAAAAISADERWAAGQVRVAGILRDALPRAFDAIAQGAIHGFDQMAQQLVSVATNALQQMPGISPLEGGLIGFVGSLVGNIFRPHDNGVRIDSYSQQALEQMRRANPEAASARIIVINSQGHTVEELLYEAGRREDRDAIDRIPVLGG